MRILSRRLWPIYLSLAFLGLMVLLTATPIVWILEGRPPETYPEIFFGICGIPFALVALLISSAIVWLRRKKP